MTRLSLYIMVTSALVHEYGHINGESSAVGDNYSFRLLSSDILSSNSYRIASSQWSSVPSSSACAVKSISACPGSRGFVYNPKSRLCAPLLWLQTGSGGDTTQGIADPEEWKLYVTQGRCREGFEAFDYGIQGHFSCLKQLTPSVSYSQATTECNSLGGYLASVKTVEKLEMVKDFAKERNHWVGMDDLAKEGVHRWQEDNQILTVEQQLAVFKTGEPNNDYGVEDCVHYRGSHRNLNDIHCWATMYALCESAPISVSC